MPKHSDGCPTQNEIDIYATCHYHCLYCIAKEKPEPKPFLPETLLMKDDFDLSLPFYLSPWTDCYPKIESREGRTRQVLQKLKKQDASYFVITKGTGIYRDADLFHDTQRTFVALSLNSLDSSTQAFFEPDLPLFKERMNLIEALVHDQNIRVVIKIDPVIPGITDTNQLQFLLTWIRKIKPYAVTSETMRITRSIAQRFKSSLPRALYNKILAYYGTPSNLPQHPLLSYRTRLFNHIHEQLQPAGVETAFCRATLPEPITSNDCRGGF